MKAAAGASLLVLLALFCTVPRVCDATCVLESDFGVVINCAFKKSSLFRIRNLGGVKAHLSWGLTIGDELGLKESLSNTEMNRRRAAPASPAQVQLIAAQQEAQKKKALVIPPPGNYSNGTTDDTSSLPNTDSEKQYSANITRFTTTISPAPTLKEVFSASKIRETPSEAISAENEISKNASRRKPSDAKRGLYTSSQTYPPSNNSTLMSIIEYIRNSLATTSPRPTRRRPSRMPSSRKTSTKTKKTKTKVGVAPKEYHPIGYARNDTVSAPSRLKLPKTSFQCKDQKYFPGLYADGELGCSVFHVCAILDSGELVTRSFLCPESTLFDQAILRCNWWFYVDCTATEKQYEINMPVARSYQLMKALATASSSIRPTGSSDAPEEIYITTASSEENV